MRKPMEVRNNKEGKPLEYYLTQYSQSDPAEMSTRCEIPWDGTAFTLKLLGGQYTATHPDLTIVGDTPITNAERILFLRYLLEGRATPPTGKYIAYQEFPWGEVYLRQFTGRCIQRYAYSYGNKLGLLDKIMSKLPARRTNRSDSGWEVELMPNLWIQFLIWEGDEEFPPNAQILFSDNFRYAFTAEDLANIGDIVMNRMKSIGAGL